jgi:hypothetical protein
MRGGHIIVTTIDNTRQRRKERNKISTLSTPDHNEESWTKAKHIIFNLFPGRRQ